MNLIKRNLRLVIFESTITSGLLMMPVATVFLNSIGLNQFGISCIQAIYTIAIICFNLPTGWLADRFSRKWTNVIGDFGGAVMLLCYSQANNFAGALICEALLGLFSAFSEGVDYTLLRHYSQQICAEENYFRRNMARLSTHSQICTLVTVGLGGPIGAINLRLAVAASSIPRFLGGFVSLFLADDSLKLERTGLSPLADMRRIARMSLTQPKLRNQIFVLAVSREMTHAVIWIFTPMMIMVGVPLEIVSGGWIMSYLTALLGTRLAKRFAERLSDRQVFALPIIGLCVSMGILTIKISRQTIGFYFIMCLIQGWTSATAMPRLQQYVKAEEQTSVISWAKTLSQCLYAVAIFLIGLAANIDLRLGCLTNLLLFAPIGILLLYWMKREQFRAPE